MFGRRAGLGASEYAAGLEHMPMVHEDETREALAEMFAPFERDSGENPYSLQMELQDTMQTLVGIIRTESELNEAVQKIRELKERSAEVSVEGNRHYNPGWHLAMDLRSLLAVSELIALAALERKESRGGHTRDDYPAFGADEGKVNVVLRKGVDGKLAVVHEQIPTVPEELKVLLEHE